MNIIKQMIAIFAITFAFNLSARADIDLSTFSQNEGIAALEAGDVAGYEVIPRKELEETRGEPRVRQGEGDYHSNPQLIYTDTIINSPIRH